ncbi:hypothetical protein NDU88_004870 [Pleurodeles waltl]|uniref:Uncharacterized protein n=1 Tax=Pleurodeles waltl TaxID=8319 RepID=A0AAV7PL16_PLEWA|nr:hypothetical protein NDU88_004870 [Pleurodeles waltl]
MEGRLDLAAFVFTIHTLCVLVHTRSIPEDPSVHPQQSSETAMWVLEGPHVQSNHFRPDSLSKTTRTSSESQNGAIPKIGSVSNLSLNDTCPRFPRLRVARLRRSAYHQGHYSSSLCPADTPCQRLDLSHRLRPQVRADSFID